VPDPTKVKETLDLFFHQVCGRQRLDLLEGLLAPGFRYHIPPDRLDTLEEVRSGFTRLFQAFPDLKFTLCDYLAADTEVMVRWHGDGTHLGAYEAIPPTGRAFHYEGVSVMAMDDDGLIRSTWMDTNLKVMVERLKVS